jgi:hypothetical protein
MRRQSPSAAGWIVGLVLVGAMVAGGVWLVAGGAGCIHRLTRTTTVTEVLESLMPLMVLLAWVLNLLIIWMFLRSAVRSGVLYALRKHHEETDKDRRALHQAVFAAGQAAAQAQQQAPAYQVQPGHTAPTPSTYCAQDKPGGRFDIVDDTAGRG